MTGQAIRKTLRVALALVLAADLSGCVSTSIDSRKAADPKAAGGALEVAVYDTPSKAHAGVPSASSVSLDLGRLDGGRETPVQSFTGPTWSLGELQPGKYRLHLRAEVLGKSPAAPPTIRREDIQIKAGEVARAEVVLKKFPTYTVVGVTVGVGVIAGVLVWYSNNLFKWDTRGLQLSHAGKPQVTSAPVLRVGGPGATKPAGRRAG